MTIVERFVRAILLEIVSLEDFLVKITGSFPKLRSYLGARFEKLVTVTYNHIDKKDTDTTLIFFNFNLPADLKDEFRMLTYQLSLALEKQKAEPSTSEYFAHKPKYGGQFDGQAKEVRGYQKKLIAIPKKKENPWDEDEYLRFTRDVNTILGHWVWRVKKQDWIWVPEIHRK